MTPVQVQGAFGEIFAEALRELRAAPRIGATLILFGWLSLAFGTQRWFLAVMSQGSPSVALGSAFWLLMAGTIMLLNASQLLLQPGAVVPRPPALASRARRLARVAGVEIAAAAVAAGVMAGLDAALSGSLARPAAHYLYWRGDVAGLTPPGPAWLVAWSAYALLHTPSQTWFWPSLAANYPGGTLRATRVLASRAGRRTPWLVHATLGTALTLAALTFLVHPSAAFLALGPLILWPALTNTAAGRVRPD